MTRQFAKSRAIYPIHNAILGLAFLALWGCATAPTPPSQGPAPKAAEALTHPERVLRSSDYVILTAEPTDTYESLARIYLGDERFANLISEFNSERPIQPGMVVVIPLKPVNPGGLYRDGYQTVPVLCYHRISPKRSDSKITVSEENFDRQMAYLKNNGYRVLTLNEFMDFVEANRRPPKKSVLITIDDGWKSARTIAYPVLKKYGFTAVLFLYTNLLKSKQNPMTLSWDDVRFMKETGVIEIGSHTVTHSDLNRIPGDQLTRELKDSQRIISEKIGVTPDVLAYPNGLFDDNTISAMKKTGYRAGFTVIRGGNPFFNNLFSLNRSMVYNSEKLDSFVKLLETYRRE